MKLLSVIVGTLLGFVVIAAFVAWVVVRFTTPSPLPTSIQAANVGSADALQASCGDGTFAFSRQACDQARQPFAAGNQATVGTVDPSPIPSPPQTNTAVPSTENAPLVPPVLSASLHDGHYDAGSKTIALTADQAIVGQSYEVNGQGGGCHVFGGNGPTSVAVSDGEWWVFDTPLSDRDLQRLMGLAEQNQQRDPQAQCAGGSQLTRV